MGRGLLRVYPRTLILFPSGTQNGFPDVSPMLHRRKTSLKTITFKSYLSWHGPCSRVARMSRAQGATGVATIESSSVGASQPTTDFVDGRIYRDVEEMRQINAAAAAKGYLLVCDRCKNLSEPIVSLISVTKSETAFGFCGDCYRKISEDFLGHVV